MNRIKSQRRSAKRGSAVTHFVSVKVQDFLPVVSLTIFIAALFILPATSRASQGNSNGGELKILIRKAYAQRQELLEASVSKTVNLNIPETEALYYNITYSNLFNAGTAVLSAVPGFLGKKRVVILKAEAKSASWLDFLYYVNDNTTSFFSMKRLYPYFQIMTRHEGIHNDFMEEKLNLNINNSKLSNGNYGKTVSSKIKNKDFLKSFNEYMEYSSVALMKDRVNIPFRAYVSFIYSQDSLSAMYYLRMFPLENGKDYYVPVFNHTKRYIVLIKARGYYNVSTPAGKFYCIRLKAYLNFNGVFSHKGKLSIYVSEGPRHTPVYLKTRVPIGFVSAILVKRAY